MKSRFYLFLLASSIAHAEVKNPVAFIGQAVLGATAGAPLSTDTNAQLVSGISNSEATATGTITTTSTTDVLMASMTLTPVSGTYLAMGSTCVDHSAQSVTVTVSLYVGGTLKADSARPTVPRFNGVGANTLSPCVATQGIVTVNGSQAIEIRWKVGSGTGTAYQRTLSIVRLS